MQSQDNYRIALLSSYALALHGLESLIPMPLPWIRVGLSNIITLMALLLFGFRAAVMVTLTRVTLASLFNGSFLGPGFILSLGGGISSILSVVCVFTLLPGVFGPVGLSLIGALFHNLSQLLLAYALFIQKAEPVLIVCPVLMLLGTITGLVNGLTTDLVIRNLKMSGISLHNN